MKIENFIITQKKIDEYYEGHGCHCPRCKSGYFSYLGGLERENELHPRLIIQIIRCKKCDLEWEEVYNLDAIRICHKGALSSDDDMGGSGSLIPFTNVDPL